MTQSLPPEILLDILSFSIGKPDQVATNTTNAIQLHHQIEIIANFQSLCKRINSNIDMIKYFTDFWMKVATKSFLSGAQEGHNENVLKLISNLKEGHKRKILLARHVKHLLLKEKMNTGKGAELFIIVLGEGGVGKSAIGIRYVLDQFMEDLDPTIEESYRKEVEIAGFPITLNILDTAGQQEHGSELRDNLRILRADCIIVVSSIDNYHSLTETCEIAGKLSSMREDKDVPIIFAINKMDLVNHDPERKEIVLKFKDEIKLKIKNVGLTNISITECSAKTLQNTNTPFEECIRRKYFGNVGYLNIIENVIKYDSKYLKKMNKKDCIIN